MESFADGADFHCEHEFQFFGGEGEGENMELQLGYRFVPHDHELIGFYLKRKLANLPLPRSPIVEVNLYDYSPEELSERYKLPGEKQCYFFTPRNRKYKNGNRPNRAARDGYWKASGADKPVTDTNNAIVGFKKSLTFFRGKPRQGEKTNWTMYEFQVNEPPQCTRKGLNGMKLDDWVICEIHEVAHKFNKSKLIRNQHQERPEPDQKEHGHEEHSSSVSGRGNYAGFERIVGEPVDSCGDNFVQIRDYYANQFYGTDSNNQSLQNQLPVLDNQLFMDHNQQLQMVDYNGSLEELQHFASMDHIDFDDLSGPDNDMKLDDWVSCEIHEAAPKVNKSKLILNQHQERPEPDQKEHEHEELSSSVSRRGNYAGFERIAGEPVDSCGDNFVQIRDYYANQFYGTDSNNQSLQNHQLPVLDNQLLMDHNQQLQMMDYNGSHEELQHFASMDHIDFDDLSGPDNNMVAQPSSFMVPPNCKFKS